MKQILTASFQDDANHILHLGAHTGLVSLTLTCPPWQMFLNEYLAVSFLFVAHLSVCTPETLTLSPLSNPGRKSLPW